MAHQRQTIREAVVLALKGATAADQRVYETRVFAWKTSDLPAISVYTIEEQIDADSKNSAPRELWRNLKLGVEAAVKSGSNVDDAIDSICQEIERAMDIDDSFGGVCGWSVLDSTTIDVVGDGEQLVGNVQLAYSVRYYTHAPEAEDVPLVPFVTGAVKTKVDGPTMPDADDADNIITPEQ